MLNCVVFSAEPLKMVKKTIPLQALIGPEGSRRLRLPDYNTFST